MFPQSASKRLAPAYMLALIGPSSTHPRTERHGYPFLALSSAASVLGYGSVNGAVQLLSTR